MAQERLPTALQEGRKLKMEVDCKDKNMQAIFWSVHQQINF